MKSKAQALREQASVTLNATTALELRVQAIELEVAALRAAPAAAKKRVKRKAK